MPRTSAVLLMILVIASPAIAQVPADDRPRHLVVDPAIVSSLAHAAPTHSFIGDQPMSAGDPSKGLDVRPIVETLTRTLSATPQMRATDTTIGMALIALGTRSRHPMSSAVFVGVHAIRLGLQPHMPPAWRAFDIRPDVSRHQFAITVRKTVGG